MESIKLIPVRADATPAGPQQNNGKSHKTIEQQSKAQYDTWSHTTTSCARVVNDTTRGSDPASSGGCSRLISQKTTGNRSEHQTEVIGTIRYDGPLT